MNRFVLLSVALVVGMAGVGFAAAGGQQSPGDGAAISESEAIDTAEETANGTAQSVEFEAEDEGPVYEIEVERADGTLVEVEVDGTSGAVVETEVEDDEDDAEEDDTDDEREVEEEEEDDEDEDDGEDDEDEEEEDDEDEDEDDIDE